MPTQRQLHIFCEAAADGNFRDTADRLGMSQPAISSHIQALERKLGVKLFVRRRGTTPLLSGDGQRLLETARQTLALNRQLSASLGNERKRRVVIGLRHFLLETAIRPSIPHFIDTHPDIDLDIRVVDDTAEMARLVRNGALDVAIYRGDPPIDRSLIYRASAPAPCSVFSGPKLARQLEADRIPIDQAPFILLPETYSASNWIMRRLDSAGVHPANVVLRSQFPGVVLQWVLEDRGLGVMFDFAAAPYLRAGALERLMPLNEPISAHILARSDPPAATLEVVDFIETLLIRESERQHLPG